MEKHAGHHHLVSYNSPGDGLVFRGDATAGVPRCGSFAFSILHD